MKKALFISASTLVAFILWTMLVKFVDVKPIGPRGSVVGLASVNEAVHRLTGTNMTLYNITDWLGLVPVAFAMGFAMLGLVQLIKRKSILKVDSSILLLGGFYIALLAVFLFFEEVVLNYRPTLINGYLEASYPSSTTLLVTCIIPTTMMQLNSRIASKTANTAINLALTAFTIFMVTARLISGVHWLTDIIGGILISVSLVTAYHTLAHRKADK